MTINTDSSEQTAAAAPQTPAEVDPRVARSRETLIAAMTELLREQPIDKITASMVAREANTSRPTLYQHFGDLTGLAVAAAVHNLEQLLFTAWEEDGPAVARETSDSHANNAAAIRNLLTHLREDQAFFLNVTQGPSSYRVTQAITYALARQLWNGLALEKGLDRSKNPFTSLTHFEEDPLDSDPLHSEDLDAEDPVDSNEPTLVQQLQFVSDGVVGNAIGWLAGTRDETVEQLAAILQNLAQRVLLH